MSETPTSGELPSIGAIRQKLKQAAYRHLKNLLKKELAESSVNCVSNGVVEAPEGSLGVCVHPDTRGDRLCDVECNPDRAAHCPLFQPRRPKDEIKEEFRRFLATAKLHEIAVEYPDVAALIWVLQGEATEREVPHEDWEPGREVEVEVDGIRLLAENKEIADRARTFLTGLVQERESLREQAQAIQTKLRQAVKEHTELQERLTQLEAAQLEETEPGPPQRASQPPALPTQAPPEDTWAVPSPQVGGWRGWLIGVLGGRP